MEWFLRKQCILLCLVYASSSVLPSVSGDLGNRQIEVLEPNGRFVVEWEVDFSLKKIIFDVTAETTGFIGFGLSPAGGMAGSDIVVGGIHPNGNSYFSSWLSSCGSYDSREENDDDIKS